MRDPAISGGNGALNKIERKVNYVVPDWKVWPRRLRRIYASLEDWGASEAAIQDMVSQWGWKQHEINKLTKDHPSFETAVDAYRETGNYPNAPHHKVPISHTHLKAVYIREGEFSSFAKLDESDRAMAFHQNVVAENDMLGLSEPYIDRRDIKRDIDKDKVEEKEDLKEAGTESGLTVFTVEENHAKVEKPTQEKNQARGDYFRGAD